jgi:hypothetical protein
VAASKAVINPSIFTTKTFPESYAAFAKQHPVRSTDQIVVPVPSSMAISVLTLGVVVVVTNTRPCTIKGYEIETTPLALKSRLHFKANGGTNGLAGSNPS